MHGELEPGQYRVVRPDGEVRVVLAMSDLVRDASGEPTGMIGTFYDITDQARAEEALEASELRRRLALWAAGMGTWEWDPASDRVKLSDETSRMLGLPEDRTIERYADYLAAVHEDDRARVDESINRVLVEGDGGRLLVAHSPDGGGTALFAVLALAQSRAGFAGRAVAIASDWTPQDRRRRSAAPPDARRHRSRATAHGHHEG